MTDRILWNRRPRDASDTGEIDEIVLRDVTIHVEQMSDECWWIGIYRGEHHWSGNFVSETPMRFSQQENDGIEWERDDSHEMTNDPRG